MFCPLCKAEYREGFAQCSDCRLALVATSIEATSIPVECFWQGSDRRECDRLLGALSDANIAYFSKEVLKANPWPWLSILLFRFMKPRPTFELKIWVLQKDMVRAREAIPENRDESEADDAG
jgi:hypothetical protein